MNWSPDNARLLIFLRGPVHGDADDKPWFTDWSVYFNLQTQKFEYTAYLERWNSQVFKLALNADYDELTSLAPASAESLTTTGAEDWVLLFTLAICYPGHAEPKRFSTNPLSQ